MELSVIIPVYNEDEIISVVLEEWIRVLTENKIDFEIRVYDDGSKDNSAEVLKLFAAKNKEINVTLKSNSGHGSTILQGYKEATSEWIFQVDSDNEMKASDFSKLWNKRDKYDFLSGYRYLRTNPWHRRIITQISRLTTYLLFGAKIKDVNSPFRLMRRIAFLDCFKLIPADSFAPNILISAYASYHNLSCFETEINCYPRQTGTVSLRSFRIFKPAAKSFIQTIKFLKTLKINANKK